MIRISTAKFPSTYKCESCGLPKRILWKIAIFRVDFDREICVLLYLCTSCKTGMKNILNELSEVSITNASNREAFRIFNPKARKSKNATSNRDK